MITPVYVNPVPVPTPDIYGAVYDFLAAYALPAMPPANIYRGWENRAALPPASNEYAIIAVLNCIRRGSNVEVLINTDAADDEPEKYQARTLFECRIQLDFLSDGDEGRQRAAAANTALRSSIGVAFFKPYGIWPHYPGDIINTAWTDEAQQYVRRYTMDFFVGYWGGVDVGTAWIEVRDDGTGFVLNTKPIRP